MSGIGPMRDTDRDMVDAIRAILGLCPLYKQDPDRPWYTKLAQASLGDGNRRAPTNPAGSDNRNRRQFFGTADGSRHARTRL